MMSLLKNLIDASGLLVPRESYEICILKDNFLKMVIYVPKCVCYDCRNHFDVPSGRSIESNVSQEVLECLYKISKSPQHEPRTMNWRHVAKKMNTFGNELESHEETIGIFLLYICLIWEENYSFCLIGIS